MAATIERVNNRDAFTYSLPGGGPPVTCSLSFLQNSKITNRSVPEIVGSSALLEFIENRGPAAPALTNFEVTGINREDNRIVALAGNITVKGSEESTPVLLTPREVGVLVVFRTHNSEQARPREHVVMISEVNNSTAAIPDVLQIPRGEMLDEKNFGGPQLQHVERICKISLTLRNFSFLTNHRSRSGGVAPECKYIGGRTDLFLYRKTVTPEELADMEREAARLSGVYKVDFLSLGDAWRSTTDSKSLVAFFIFHEMRYYGVMPPYRPPTDSIADIGAANPADTTRWTEVTALNPNVRNYHMLLRVHEPVTFQEVPSIRNRGQMMKRGQVILGDRTGIVTLVLTEGQCNAFPAFSEVGTPVVLKNCSVYMDDAHLKLRIRNRYGQLIIGEEAMKGPFDFDFTPNPSFNCSMEPYELETGASSPSAAGMSSGAMQPDAGSSNSQQQRAAVGRGGARRVSRARRSGVAVGRRSFRGTMAAAR